MRTIDPETWYKRNTKLTKTQAPRKLFGTQSMTAYEKILRNSFSAAMMDFWTNCSIGGIIFIRQRSMPRNLRHCFVAFVLLLLLLGLLGVWRSWQSFRDVPLLIVTQVAAKYSVRNVDFPAVALCTNNAVSKSALKKYADYVYSLDVNSTYSLEDIERNLLTFGALVTWSNTAVDGSFMEYLARVAHVTNVTDIIMKLTPQCSSFLTRCGWRTARVPCEKLFAMRPTPHGYCCVFNSRYHDEDLHNPARRLQFLGQDSGLSVVVQEDINDMAFLRGPVEGLEVILFEGSEYPLIEGGSSKVYLSQRDTSAYIQLSARTQYASSNLEYFNEKWRGCRMRRARSRSMEHRSHTWCLTSCRRHTVQALCGCVPHLLLPGPKDTVCSPDQLACLNKHKEKFTNFYPGDVADPSLNEESSDSLFCEHCVPDCTRLVYSAAINHVNYQFTTKLFLNFFLSGLSLINSTVLRVYYESEEQNLYVVEPNRQWYEIVSILGSQWLCVMAVTFVGVLELLYHITIRWVYHFNQRRSFEDKRKLKLRPLTIC